MRRPIVLMIFLFCSAAIMCQGRNATNVTDSATKRNTPKMSAKERLAKNNILEHHNNLGSMLLKGKVKTRTETSYKLADDGKKIDEGTMMDSFDAKGNNVLSLSHAISNGKITESRDSAAYDANNNVIAGYLCRKNGKVLLMTEIKYDSRGNEIASISHYDNGKVSSVDSYKYDDKDNLIEMYLDKNVFFSKALYKYDTNGFVTEGQIFDSTGKPSSRHTRKYDDKGNELYVVSYKADGAIEDIDSVQHDEKGNKTAYITYNADGSLKSKWRYDYDDKGHIIHSMKYKNDNSIDNEISKSFTYEYDATGNVTKQTTYQMKGGRKVVTEVTETVYNYY